jgi:hypothetical protein
MLALHALALGIVISTAPTETRYLAAVEGTWEAHFLPTIVQLNLHIDRERGSSTFTRAYNVDDLRELRRERRAIGFEMRRDAGTFRFDGTARDLRGSGVFAFTPNNRFKKSVERLGLTGIKRSHLLTFALHNLTTEDVKVIQRSVYGKLTTAELIRLLDSGADAHYVRDLAGVGFGKLTPQLLVHLRTKDVDADYVRGMRAVGLVDLTLADFMRLREHDVTSEYALSLFQAGYDCLDVDDLVRLRDHGITADYIKNINKHAGEELGVKALIRHRGDIDF